MSLELSTSLSEGVCSVRVNGEVDVSNADELRQALDEATGRDCQSIEVDLSDVAYIDSTGIGVLVGAAHRAGEEGRTLTVLRPQRNVARVLTLLGVGDQLGIRS